MTDREWRAMILPVDDERHVRATGAAAKARLSDALTEEVIAAYFAELERQGVRMVPLAEVVDWLWAWAPVVEVWRREQIADAVAARFGGGER